MKKISIVLDDVTLNEVKYTIADFPRRYSHYLPKCYTPQIAKKGYWRIKHIKNENFQIVIKLENSYADISRSRRTSVPYLYISLSENGNNVLLKCDFRMHIIDKISCILFVFCIIALVVSGILLSMGNYVAVIFYALLGTLVVSMPLSMLVSSYLFNKIRMNIFLEILNKNFKISVI